MTEMAIVSVRKARLQHEMEKGNRKARTALSCMKIRMTFSTIQIFITLVGVITGAVGACLSVPWPIYWQRFPFSPP